MDDKNIFEIKNLHFTYQQGKEVFKGLKFSLNRGDKIGIIGSNGSGKTTLFHIIMGLVKPSEGDICIFGKKRINEKDFFEVRQRIGLLFQDSDDQLFCPTVEEDIAFGPLNLGKSHKEVKIIVKDVCERLGLSGLERRVTYRLSGGEKRLVSFATLAAMNPECLLLDEPTSGLDEKTTERILEYIRKNIETYIIVSHDTDFLKKAVNKIYLLENGKIHFKEAL